MYRLRHYFFISLIVFSVSLFQVADEALAQPDEVTIDLINYCRTIWPLCNDTLQQEYHWWEDRGVPDQTQKKTFIGSYNEPQRSQVKNIVFLSAGQRIGNGKQNQITGQPNFSSPDPREPNETFDISTGVIDRPLSYELFRSGVYSEDDTYVALAFDARYNHDFNRNRKLKIRNAYFDWLTSKVDSANLESVYLVGHSRGGSLVFELAKMFQQAYPHVVVVLHGVDPVAKKNDGELGTFGSSIENPVAGFSKNWAWKTNLRSEFPSKSNFAVKNFVIGGSAGDLLLGVRAFTLDTAVEAFTDIGWYQQEWFTFSNIGNGGGHLTIANRKAIVNLAIDHLRDRLDILQNNISPQAMASASSTYSGYSASLINDTNLDSRAGPQYSWTNSDTSLPQWVQLTWSDTIQADAIELITSENYPISQFRVEYRLGNTWIPLTLVNENQGIVWRLDLSSLFTDAIRVVGLRGPDHQPQYVRVNELIVRGDFVNPPNVPPVAHCQANPSFGGAALVSTLTSNGSEDIDGSIVSYQWNFSDGEVYTGATVVKEFTTDLVGDTQFATLIVTDNDGAIDTAICAVDLSAGGGPEECSPSQILPCM